MRNLTVLSLLLSPVMLMGGNIFQPTPSSEVPLKNENVTLFHEAPYLNDEHLALNSFLTFGGNYSRLNLKPNGESSFNGNLGGAQTRYEYRPLNAFYGAIEFEWREGKTHGSGGTRDILKLDTAEKLGYTWQHDRWLITFFTGFGFRFLRQHLHSSSSSESTFNGSFFPPFVTDSTSMKFDYYEFYFPLGFAAQYNFTSCFSLGINFEWMPQAFPTVQIRPLGGTYWSLKNKIANFLVEMPFIFNFSDRRRWFLVVNPFYERWQDGHSTAKTSGGTPLGLPQNTYNYYGADVNVIYSF